MDFVRRKIEPLLAAAAGSFPAVILTGPRRCGKTCLLRHAFPDATYVQLEDPDVLLRVKADPRGFLDAMPHPAIIDEIQQAPELFNYVRSRIDAAPEAKGRWLLTGSQEALLMKGVSESMSGRAAILRLSPFSVGESPAVSPLRGGYPEALAMAPDAGLWFSSYVQTYLERDVRAILAVKNLVTFHRFVKLLATRHGQMLNKTDLAAPLGVSVPTVTQWLNVLETSGLILRVAPFYRNAGKRLVKTPKIYFADSGLACHLLGIRTEEELQRSPFCGPVFEGFVIAEAVKARQARGEESEAYYFRDEQGLEVDLVLAPGGGRLLLAECKAAGTVTPEMSRPMRQLAKKFAADGDQVETFVVHQPGPGAPTLTTVGPGVAACSVAQFVARLEDWGGV